MSNRGESVILPSNAVFLVHKVGGTKAGRGSQWETRTKSMRVAPNLAPRISVAVDGNNDSKSNPNNTEGGSREFVAYTPGKRQQLTKRPKEVKRGRRAKRSATPPKDRSLVSVKKEPKLSRNPSPMPPELPVGLVGHALLYINFCMLLPLLLLHHAWFFTFSITNCYPRLPFNSRWHIYPTMSPFQPRQKRLVSQNDGR